jgi:hypothetical protein
VQLDRRELEVQPNVVGILRERALELAARELRPIGGEVSAGPAERLLRRILRAFGLQLARFVHSSSLK